MLKTLKSENEIIIYGIMRKGERGKRRRRRKRMTRKKRRRKKKRRRGITMKELSPLLKVIYNTADCVLDFGWNFNDIKID